MAKFRILSIALIAALGFWGRDPIRTPRGSSITTSFHYRGHPISAHRQAVTKALMSAVPVATSALSFTGCGRKTMRGGDRRIVAPSALSHNLSSA
jgi:hypothetical protein